jgi:hypothetical protein
VLKSSWQVTIETERIKARHLASPWSRREDVANFILSVVSVAQDLKRVCNIAHLLREDDKQFSANAEDLAQALEQVICNRYRELFGTELGK